MTSHVNEGVLAFPCDSACARGMTLRDYFIAHAPAEPQPWFRPVTEKKPEKPAMPATFDELDARRADMELNGFRMFKPNAKVDKFMSSEAVAEWIAAKALWEDEYERQRYIQWPAAWADAMLEQRKKGGAA